MERLAVDAAGCIFARRPDGTGTTTATTPEVTADEEVLELGGEGGVAAGVRAPGGAVLLLGCRGRDPGGGIACGPGGHGGGLLAPAAGGAAGESETDDAVFSATIPPPYSLLKMSR
jgi:hypothetical protein